MPVHNNILKREARGGTNFLNTYCASESVVQRFELHQTLKSHYGCVNTVNWNTSGSLLISGSDDTNLCVYDYQKGCELVTRIETGHSANIFSAKFLPFQDDRIACCAGDDEVRTFHNFSPDQIYTCHSGRVKKIATHNDFPLCFLSASEDGTVRHFDTRIRGSEQGDHIVVAVGSQYGKYNLEVYSLAYDPLCSHYFIVGGGDPYVRLYDTRVLKFGGKVGEREKEREREKEDHRCVKAFCPKKMKDKREDFSMNGHITGVAYSWDGREVIASYSGDAVYLFDIKDNNDARTKGMKELPEDDDDIDMDEDEEDEEDESDENNNNNIKKKKKSKGKQKVEEKEEKKEKKEREKEKEKESEEDEEEHKSYKQKYTGHCNVRTVKEVNFYGPHSEYVVSGSDCGRIFIWDKKTGKVMNMLVGDRDVVNCASGHPFDPVLATSGIERNVKLWLPKAETPRIITEEDCEIMKRNTTNTTSRNTNLFALIRALTRRQVEGEDGEEENFFFPFVRRPRAAREEGENESTETNENNENENNENNENNEEDDEDDEDEGLEGEEGERCVRCQQQ